MSSPLARYHQATQSWPAAILLYRVTYWWPKATHQRNGYTWIAKSCEAWCDETDLTPKEYKTAVQNLRHRRLIITERRQFHGKLMTHLRLTAQGEQLMTEQPLSQSPEGPTALAPGGPSAQAPEGPSLYKGVTFNTYEQGEEDGVLAHAPPAGVGSLDSFNEDSGKGKKKMKAQDVLQKIHKPQGHLSLEELWKDTLADLKGAFVPAFTNKQKGQIKQFAKTCPPGKAALVLEHTLRRWLIFTETVEADAGAYKTPASPDVGFLLKHAGIAVTLWQQYVAKPKFVPVVVQSTAQTKDPEPEEEPPTKEEAFAFFYPELAAKVGS